MREISSPLLGISSPFGARRNPLAAYAAAGFVPKLVANFTAEFYAKEGQKSTFGGVLEPTATTNGTMVDSDGLPKWRPHNLVPSSDNFSHSSWASSGITLTLDTATCTRHSNSVAFLLAPISAQDDQTYTSQVDIKITSGQWVTLEVWSGNSTNGVRGWFDLQNGVKGTLDATSGFTAVSHSIEAKGDGVYRIKVKGTRLAAGNVYWALRFVDGDGAYNFTATNGNSAKVTKACFHRSDLGGMVDNPDTGDSYVPTTTSALYLPRRNHHVWNGSAWVNAGVLIEPETRTNLLLNSGSLSTQSVTVSANPHTLHFTGTGSITLSGAHSATLSGAGTGEENRASLTFTPSAGTLVVTVSGTVTNAQLEEGSTPSSFIPTYGSQVARAGEQLVLPHGSISWPAGDELSIHVKGLMTGQNSEFVRWRLDASNYISLSSGAGDFTFAQAEGGTVDSVTGGSFTSGTNVSFNIASRNGSTFINGAVDGAALTENTTPTTFPDLETTNLQLAYSGGSMILKEVSLWDVGIGDAGIEDATDD